MYYTVKFVVTSGVQKSLLLHKRQQRLTHSKGEVENRITFQNKFHSAVLRCKINPEKF